MAIFSVDINTALTEKALQGIKVTDARKADVKKIIREEMMKAKRNIIKVAKEYLRNDPRQAHKAIKMNVYKRGAFGANVSIHDKRGGKVTLREYNPPRKGTRGQRNISDKTKRRNSYFGQSRAFVLRFQTLGTPNRSNKKWVKEPNRGQIIPRDGDWFTRASEKEVQQAGEVIGKRLIDLMTKDFNR